MTLSRRGFVALVRGAVIGMALALLSNYPSPASAQPVSVDVRAERLPNFNTGNPGVERFGKLRFRSGVVLSATHPNFGGFSGLWRSPKGDRIVAVTDRGFWLTADVLSDSKGIASLGNTVIAPILDREGKRLAGTRFRDVEALIIEGGIAYIAIERVQTVFRFNFAADGVRARGERVPVPAESQLWPRNKGLESIGIAPPASPAAGAIVVIAERSREGDDAPTQGFILTGDNRGAFDVSRSDGFDVTDMEFLENGDILLLERRFRLLGGVAARIRYIPGGLLQPGALLDGPVIFTADRHYQIDNMEGLATHRDADGSLILTLVSDDNFSFLQRTLMLEFVLEDAPARD